MPAPPAISARMPAINIQTDLSVGVPVKNRDRSELNESIATTPMTIRAMPTMTRAVDIMLFMLLLLVVPLPNAAIEALDYSIDKQSNRSAMRFYGVFTP